MTDLRDGWELASAGPDRYGPGDLQALEWRPAQVPGTAAAAVSHGGRDFDTEDWFFRVSFARPDAPADVHHVLELGGIATVSEVYLNGRLVLESSSMWARYTVDVTDRLTERNELLIICRALAPRLRSSRRPRQRWRSRLVHDGNLRWYRTMIFGRSPGYAEEPAPVGPWRPVRLLAVGPVGLDELSVRTHLDGQTGVVRVRARVRGGGDAAVTIGSSRVTMTGAAEAGWLEADVRIDEVRRWWPHTHGDPELYELTVEIDGQPMAHRKVGFRTLEWAEDFLADGLDLHVNGVPVFARGAVWTPADLVSMAPTDELLERLLVMARDAGMNMLRIVGTGAYESSRFHDLCDELGILVWQDLMFASLDYPLSDPEFFAECEREIRQLLRDLGGRPSLAVLCGSHELEQQPAMLGLEPGLARDPFWEVTIPEWVAAADVDCAYLRSTPCGGDLPFTPDKGVVHYFGVGGYFRDPAEVRRDAVKFAPECLPFANLPDHVEFPTHHPAWKAGVQRDAGPAFQRQPGFDFDDVRDFYLQWLYSLDPVALRRVDQDRYVSISRLASGEMIAEVLGEWRRAGSPCRGALVLWLKDMAPGAGFGLIDHAGAPKAAYHYARRAMAPVAVWTTDEGLAGVAIHLVNDRPRDLDAKLRVAVYQDMEVRVAEVEEAVTIPAHGALERSVEGMLGRFIDSGLAYGFGPPAHDLVVATLTSVREEEQLSQAFRFPRGRPVDRASASQLGVEAHVELRSDEDPRLVITARHLLYGVRIDVPGFEPEDQVFCVEPGVTRVVRLRPCETGAEFTVGALSALSLNQMLPISSVSDARAVVSVS